MKSFVESLEMALFLIFPPVVVAVIVIAVLTSI